MDLREWFAEQQRFQIVRSEAHLILANLQASPAEAVNGLRGVTQAAQQARQELRNAKLAASNTSAPEPDNPEAAISCGWCGNSLFQQLENDGAEDGPEEWFCSDGKSCQERRSQRYPDKQTRELKMARAQDEYWRREAEAAVFALTAWKAAAAQETTLALTARQRHPQPRPGGNPGRAPRSPRHR